eukprot:4127608-Pyramimonas_sp.AAC.1
MAGNSCNRQFVGQPGIVVAYVWCSQLESQLIRIVGVLADYGFEYSDEEPEEEDVDIENQYYNSKGAGLERTRIQRCCVQAYKLNVRTVSTRQTWLSAFTQVAVTQSD